MSQYRGYFVPGKVDPKGTFTCTAKMRNSSCCIEECMASGGTNDQCSKCCSEKFCGPNVTGWLLKAINTNAKNKEVLRIQGLWYGPIDAGEARGAFDHLVGPGQAWDFKRTVDFTTQNCPIDCPRTVSLCGFCVNYDVPGNIHYGYIGRVIGFTEWELLFWPGVVQDGGGPEDGRDSAAIQIGMDMHSLKGSLCSLVRQSIGSLNRDGTTDCNLCSENCNSKIPFGGPAPLY